MAAPTATATSSASGAPPASRAATGDPSPGTRLVQNVSAVAVWSALIYTLPVGPLSQFWLAVLLLLIMHRVIRRRHFSELCHRDHRVRRTAIEWAVFLPLVPVAGLAFLMGGEPSDDRLWTGTVVVAGVTVLQLIIRRGVLAVVAVLLGLTVFTLATAPRLDTDRSGDADLLAQLNSTHGYHRLSVAVIDLDAAVPVRYANVGSTPTTRFEVGSITKALTGLAIADEVDRGELRLDDPVNSYLPLGDCAAGRVSLRDLVTHSSGYPRVTEQAQIRNVLGYSFGVNSEGIGLSQLERELAGVDLGPREFRYSNVGAAVAGQAAARAAHRDYPQLMNDRLFTPLHMADTAIATTALVDGGFGASGRPAAPIVMAALAPTGAAVSTSADLGKLIVALLTDTAPGMRALEPIAAADYPGSKTGILWGITTRSDGTVVTEKNGKTAGYSSYLALDRDHRRGVVVLADVNRGVDLLGDQLLTSS